MIRLSTLLWLSGAVLCGALLFQTSQQVTDGQQRLSRLKADIAREEESLRVMQAEWSHLNQPDRLERLSRQYLKLRPLKAAQFVRLEDLTAPPATLDTALPETPPAVAPLEESAPVIHAVAEEGTLATPRAPQPKPPVPVVAKKSTTPKTAATGPKIVRPAAPPAKTPPRDFNDMLRGLGVE